MEHARAQGPFYGTKNSSPLCSDLYRYIWIKKVENRGYKCVCITDSLSCTVETKITF